MDDFPIFGGIISPNPTTTRPVDIPVLDTISRTYWQWILSTLLDRNHLGSLPIPVRSPAIFPCWVNYLTIHHHNHGLQTSQNLMDHQEHITNAFSAICSTELPLEPTPFHWDLPLFERFLCLWGNYLTPSHNNHGLLISQKLIHHKKYILNEFCALCLTEFPLNPTQFHWHLLIFGAIFPSWVNYLPIPHHNHGLQTSHNLVQH